MIKKLRKRITILLTAITSVILITCLILAMYFSVKQQKSTQSANSLQIITNVMVYMESGSTSNEILTKLEKENHCAIYIETNNKDYEFINGYESKTDRKTLKVKFEETIDNGISEMEIEREYSVSVGIEESISTSSVETDDIQAVVENDSYYYFDGFKYTFLQGDYGETYKASVVEGAIKVDPVDTAFPDVVSDYAEEELYTIYLIQDAAKENREIAMIYIGYILLMILGIAAFTVIDYLISGIITKPTAEGIKRQTEFVASASHELRSPLAVIKSSLEAAKIAQGSEESEKFYSNVESESNRMNRLVEDLLVIAENDAQSWTLKKETVDIDTLLIELNEQFAPLMKKKHHVLKLELPEDTLGEIVSDKDRIKQILSIFLDNAIEHTPENTEVVLKSYIRKKDVYIEVTDNGDGVDDKEKTKLFDRFYKADKSRTDKSHFGLGLSIAKEMANLIHGKILVEDTLGGGTTFILALPLKQ